MLDDHSHEVNRIICLSGMFAFREAELSDSSGQIYMFRSEQEDLDITLNLDNLCDNFDDDDDGYI